MALVDQSGRVVADPSPDSDISEGRVRAQRGLFEGEKGRPGTGGVELGLQIESELPLLGKRGAAHLHRQTAVPRAAAVEAQVATQVSEFGVIVDLLPFLQQKQWCLKWGRQS